MKREEKNESSKEKILKASLKEFGQKGYVEASTNSICKNHEISKGLLFHYYKTKDELFLVCVEKCFEEMAQYLREQMDESIVCVEEALNHYFEIRFEFFKAYPLYEQIFYTAMITPPEHLKEEIKKRREEVNLLNRDFLTHLMDRVPLKPHIDPEAVVELVYGMSNYLHMKYKGDYSKDLQVRHQVVINHSKEIKEMIMILFYGIIG